MEFYQVDPTLDNYWRAIILFGRNVASYKFALAKALQDLSDRSNDLITLDELAIPFSGHLCEHLKVAPKQTTAPSSQFLDSCLAYNQGQLSQDELIAATARLGFVNVIDAFHNVNNAEIAQRFFIDERKTHKGIRLTDQFYQLAESPQFKNLTHETEARWSLVEKSWELGISRNLLTVEYDKEEQSFFTSPWQNKRVTITSSRDGLNGYQKGHCFYCFDEISVLPGHEKLADVDHFFPWAASENIRHANGLWNLVLACKDCNRGVDGKFAKVPNLKLLERLHKRNEYLINSHLPLRETLISQTGKTENLRRQFLQQQYNQAKRLLIHEWQTPEPRLAMRF